MMLRVASYTLQEGLVTFLAADDNFEQSRDHDFNDKNTFQPHTGVRTCLLVVEKNKAGTKNTDYPILMAISRKVGQDSEWVPIYKRDATNNITGEIDHDLGDIAKAYRPAAVG